MQAQKFMFYAWRLSWYSGKVRSYLQHKGIPFTEKKPSLFTFKKTIPQHCGGDGAIPGVVSPEGEWLQDSTIIIERLESRYPDAPVVPATPVQCLFSMLVEIWADEYWHPTAEHYRFSFPENYPIWRDELSSLLPGFTRFLQHAVVKHFYPFMLVVTRQVGVEPAKYALIERWSEAQLDALDKHFETMPYLLGSRACLADFSLMGPINGHLAWDPYSFRKLIEPRKNLHRWIQRMSKKDSDIGAFLPDDEIPATLQPVIASLFGDLLPYLEKCADLAGTLPRESDTDPRYARLGPTVTIPYGDGELHRVVVPYTLWMVQRLLDRFRQLPESESRTIQNWLQLNGGGGLLSLKFPRLRRVGLHVAPEIPLD